MQQLVILLKSNPNGLRRAEIARRLGVHRSTIGRYIDQLSLSSQVWERDGFIGLELQEKKESDPHFNVHEGIFLYSLILLYQQELNIKNPYASSVMRKLSESFTVSAPVLSDNLLSSADYLESEGGYYPNSYIDKYEKISEAWTSHTSVKISYLHTVSGESCWTVFKPQEIFIAKNGIYKSSLAVEGICSRTGESCRLRIAEFVDIEVLNFSDEDNLFDKFCPISEFALKHRPQLDIENEYELSIQESNHRIKNSLFMTSSLMEITFSDISDEDISSRVKILQNRIETIAVIHEQLTATRGNDYIRLEKYLPELVNRTAELMSGKSDLNNRIRIDRISLSSLKALPLGMIICELVTNSFKHNVDKSKIKIILTVKALNGKIKLHYSDGGEGFRLDGKRGDCGSGLIRNFCRQLNCIVSYKKNVFILEFPV